jgi:hypothetical protein
MTTPVTLADGSTFPYGMGEFVTPLAGHRAIFHSGGVSGFVAWLASYPDDDLYVAVLANAEGPFDRLGEDIARLVLKLPKPPIVDLPVEASEAAAVAGTYDAIGIAKLVVEADGGQLFVHADGANAGERARLQHQADGSYVISDANTSITFVRSGDRVTRFDLNQGGVTVPAYRTP